MKSGYKKLAGKIVYKNPWIRVREDKILHPDGKPGIYGVVEIQPSVFAVAIDNDKNVYLTRQHRYPTDNIGLEVPAGSIEGESLLDAAKRELNEETGLTAKKWSALGSYHAMNGYSDSLIHIYLAQDLTQDSGYKPPIGEGVAEVVKVPVAEVYQLIASQEIIDGQSALALFIALRELDY